MDNVIYLAIDADDAGKLVGRAALADDEAALADVSSRIDRGQQIILDWAEKHGGNKISAGGDEANIKVPEEAKDFVEELRNDYHYATGMTITVGVGSKLSEAGKSLMVGKFRGKDIAVFYGPEIESEIAQAHEHVQQGTATDEEKKIDQAYFEENEGNTKNTDQQSQGTDDCPHCKEIEKTDACPYCQKDAVLDSENLDNCSHCKELDKDKKDSCPYCEHGDKSKIKENTSQAVDEISNQIEVDDPEKQEEADIVRDIDDADLAIGVEMDQNASVTDSYKQKNFPQDMGLSEEENKGPEFGNLIKEDLDSRSQDIQNERLKSLIGEALEGIKNNKNILEKAKQQAPEFYSAALAMIKAMIEMSKALGIKINKPEPSGREDIQSEQSAGQHSQGDGPEEDTVGTSIKKLPTKHTTKHVARTPYPPGAINEKGQQKVIDPVTGKIRWIDRKDPKVASATGIPVKPESRN